MHLPDYVQEAGVTCGLQGLSLTSRDQRLYDSGWRFPQGVHLRQRSCAQATCMRACMRIPAAVKHVGAL